ncbi:hypothetical protein [Levilactobacillus zymae]|uniref:Small membrane protein n=1 Tax=Levilactobacillus zymae TaxID=267363 RepID=A0A1Y6JVZ1_9LACO|nr:hypothetical protein [Levilactobacillus zymae]KRL15412.1 hypothetical protein FD38_GL000407 [Levilactobacillus zymae DSM 19395]QFR60914.1 hypothetical protein LZ395_04935 [Levilactobacillus zymae]GEO71142.1 hypothetical protein LZY01_03100 [Levilactobacillus zymae]SMS14025.1 Small membrane protein [Levilactobacillus zymae]
MRNDWQSDDDQPKTRADYRREQEQAEREANERDRQRNAAERKSARNQPADDLDPDADPNSATGPLDDHTPQAKQRRLGRRLNWAIFWLAVLIVAVYLILFFVEF